MSATSAIIDVGTIDFAVYEDSTEFIGIANSVLPDKSQKVITLTGAGIGGDVEVPIRGAYNAMEMSLAFRAYTPRIASLREQRVHIIEIRVAQQNEDRIAGQVVTEGVKHVFKVLPKSTSGGTVAPASPSDTTITFAVRYWATFFDGKLIEEWDPLNRIDVINGIDYDEPVRRALGK